MTLIDLGGGTLPHPSADYVVDLHHPRNAPAQDAAQAPWLFHIDGGMHHMSDGVVDVVYASHFLEHIPSGQARLNVLNEAHRVLKPGGRFDIVVPLIGYTDPSTGQPQSNQIGWQPWADPTHVSFWWFPESLLYFCEGAFKPNADYGNATWAPLGNWTSDPHGSPVGGWTVRHEWEGIASLIKG